MFIRLATGELLGNLLVYINLLSDNWLPAVNPLKRTKEVLNHQRKLLIGEANLARYLLGSVMTKNRPNWSNIFSAS